MHVRKIRLVAVVNLIWSLSAATHSKYIAEGVIFLNCILRAFGELRGRCLLLIFHRRASDGLVICVMDISRHGVHIIPQPDTFLDMTRPCYRLSVRIYRTTHGELYWTILAAKNYAVLKPFRITSHNIPTTCLSKCGYGFHSSHSTLNEFWFPIP